MAPCTHPGTSGEVNEARGRLILAAGRVRRRKENERKKHEIPPNTKKTHHGINPQQPGDRDHLETACDETRPTRSPYSHDSSIDPGFVEIGLACIHTYVYTRAAAAAPRVYVSVLYFLASAASSSSAVILVCNSGFGVVRWCLTLSFKSAHGIRRLDVYCCARGVFCCCFLHQRAESGGVRCAA